MVGAWCGVATGALVSLCGGTSNTLTSCACSQHPSYPCGVGMYRTGTCGGGTSSYQCLPRDTDTRVDSVAAEFVRSVIGMSSYHCSVP